MGVDVHVASKYLQMNKDNVQNNEKIVDIFSSAATEIMRVMNYYAFENPDSTLDTLYYCGGASVMKRYVEEIANMVNLDLKPLAELSESKDDDEAVTKGAAALGVCYTE